MDKNAYTLPEVYEIAFSFRDYGQAVDFLCEATGLAGLDSVTSVVELGCGPGQYCREFSRRKIRAVGVDQSADMVEYAQKCVREEGLACKIIESDMRSFELAEPADLAVCMMATFHCLLTNDDIITHLNSVADNLTDNGIYIIEMAHPRYIFEKPQVFQNDWKMERNGITVRTQWGRGAETDPLTEIVTGTVLYDVTDGGTTKSYSFREQWREIPQGLICALIDLSGRFHIAAMYGDLNINIPFDNNKKAWRMVLVLWKDE